jgi:hypothetical protein
MLGGITGFVAVGSAVYILRDRQSSFVFLLALLAFTKLTTLMQECCNLQKQLIYI